MKGFSFISVLTKLSLVLAIKAQFYFTNSYYSVDTKKDISGIKNNLDTLETVLDKLSLGQINILKIERNSTGANLGFSRWLDTEILTCKNAISQKVTKIKSIYKTTLHSHLLDKRNIIGDAWAYISGMETPLENLHKEEALKKMTLTLSGQNTEMHEIQNVLGDEMVLIDSVKSEVKNMLNREFETEKSLESFSYYI